jgi:hypothetical protein
MEKPEKIARDSPNRTERRLSVPSSAARRFQHLWRRFAAKVKAEG